MHTLQCHSPRSVVTTVCADLVMRVSAGSPPAGAVQLPTKAWQGTAAYPVLLNRTFPGGGFPKGPSPPPPTLPQGPSSTCMIKARDTFLGSVTAQ